MQINASTRMLTLVIFIIISVLLLGVGFYYRQKSKRKLQAIFRKTFSPAAAPWDRWWWA